MRNVLCSFFTGLCVACLNPVWGSAKPLLTDSQDTYVSACIRESDTPRRLIRICESGLSASGFSHGQKAEMLKVLGWAHFDQDQHDLAEKAFREILALDPGSMQGHYGLAWIAFHDDDYARAVVHFQKSADRTPRGGNISGLGAALYRGDKIDLKEFHSYLDTALALSPKNAWALREKGWALAENDAPEAALAFFERAIDIRRDDGYAQFGMASALSDLDRNDEALEHINAALAAEPDIYSWVRERALILLRLQRPKQALKDAQVLVKLDPDRASGYVYTARAQNKMGKRGDAIAGLNAAATHLDDGAYLGYWRAWFYFQDAAYDRALDIARHTSKLEDADEADFRLHARIALQLDALTEANELITRALDEKPESEWSLFYQSLILVAQKEYTEGEAAFDKAIEAGLSDEELSDFLSALVSESRFVQAIKMRVRYQDRKASRPLD